MRRVVTAIRQVGLLTAAFALAVSTLAGIVPTAAHAAGGTSTWVGTAGDHKFSTASNWASGVIPVAGDALVFNTAPNNGNSSNTNETLINDVNVAFASVSTQTTGSSYLGSYSLSQSILLQDGATWSQSQYLNLNAASGVVAQGSLSVVSGYVYLTSAVGAVTVKSGAAAGIIAGSTIGSLIINNGANVAYSLSGSSTSASITHPITFGGGTATTAPALAFYPSYDANGNPIPVTYTVSGSLSLLSNANFIVSDKVTANVTGTTSGSGTITRDPNSSYTGTLTVGGQNLVNPTKTTTLSDSKPTTYYSVVDKETLVLDGTYGSISVQGGGALMGNGTGSSFYIAPGAVISPGHSPGTLTTTGDLYLYGTYHAEVLDKNNYDKIVVGGNVYLGSSGVNEPTLDLAFLSGGTVNQGDTFTIIKNNGGQPINGTFSGLAEGSKITAGNAVFAISYKGGAGNDVVLTALNTAAAPKAPNTGFFAPVLANPAIVAVLGIASVIALVIVRKAAKR